MTRAAPSPLTQHDVTVPSFRLALLALAALGFAYLVFLQGLGLYAGPDAGGHEKQVDFVAFYAAGQMALAGEATSAYDAARHDRYVTALVGPHSRSQGWHNPPSFLLLTAPLALLTFASAKLLFVGASLAAFALAVRKLGGHPGWWVAALAFPSVLAVGISGQNGLLTAALVGGMLACLNRRPWLAGLWLGCLTIKPQLGVLIPFALLAGGNWRTVVAAGATAVVLGLVAGALFGSEGWTGFFASLAGTSDAMLGRGVAAFGKMQSVFGVVRNAGGGVAAAAIVQAVFGAAVAAFVCRLWWRGAAFELRGAALAVGIVLVQPYVYIYDEAVLAVAVALIVRLGVRVGFWPGDLGGIATACAALLFAVTVTAHFGLVAALVLLALVGRRARRAGLDATGFEGHKS